MDKMQLKMLESKNIMTLKAVCLLGCPLKLHFDRNHGVDF